MCLIQATAQNGGVLHSLPSPVLIYCWYEAASQKIWSRKMPDYTVIAEDTWELYAPVQEPDPWEPLMRDLSEGKIVCLPYTDARDRRAKRLSIARRARSW